MTVGAVGLLAACGGGGDDGPRNAGSSGVAAPDGGKAGSGGSAGSKAGNGGSGNSGTGGGAGAISTIDAGIGPDVDAATLPVFDAGTDPDPNAVQPGMICERISTIQCAGEQHCCATPNRTFDACKVESLDACLNTAYIDSMAANPITGFDAAYAKDMLTTYETMASLCDPNVTEWGAAYGTGLPAMLRGTVAAGGSCTPKGNVQDRTVIAAALASCTDLPTQACLPKASSIGVPLIWKCTAKAAAGGECFTDVNCATGLYCDNPNFDIGGVECKARKGVGELCANPNECASLFCKRGICVQKSMQAAYCLRND